jgi:hypothetical protein
MSEFPRLTNDETFIPADELEDESWLKEERSDNHA